MFLLRLLVKLFKRKPSDIRVASAIRKMFEDAEKEGYTYKVDRAGIRRVKIEEKKDV